MGKERNEETRFIYRVDVIHRADNIPSATKHYAAVVDRDRPESKRLRSVC